MEVFHASAKICKSAASLRNRISFYGGTSSVSHACAFGPTWSEPLVQRARSKCWVCLFRVFNLLLRDHLAEVLAGTYGPEC
jgi:hypothetical protein